MMSIVSTIKISIVLFADNLPENCHLLSPYKINNRKTSIRSYVSMTATASPKIEHCDILLHRGVSQDMATVSFRSPRSSMSRSERAASADVLYRALVGGRLSRSGCPVDGHRMATPRRRYLVQLND